MIHPRYMSRSVLHFQCAIRIQASAVVSWEVFANETSGAGRIATDFTWQCQSYLDLAELWPVELGCNNIFAENVIQNVALEANPKLLAEAPSALKSGGV